LSLCSKTYLNSEATSADVKNERVKTVRIVALGNENI
jgi:hypothetical protein